MLITSKLKHKMLMKTFDVLTKLLNVREPSVFIGRDSSRQLCKALPGYGITNLLMVTDADIARLGLHQKCLETLESVGLKVSVFDGVEPDPSNELLEKGVAVLKQNGCDGVLGFGGGSSIDAGKIIAARATNDMPIEKMEGPLKIKKSPLPTFAIPTTAGTGSEVTMGAIITLKESERKITIADPKIVPQAAALDPLLTLTLPGGMTSATGMDVLTHGLEGYISTRVTPKIAFHSRTAIKLTFDHLENAYNNPEDVDAREGMLLAAYHGGLSIGNGAGYVHAIAHQLGAIYHVPHGLANAVALSPVMRFSRDAIIDKLAQLAVLIGVGNDREDPGILADRFLEAIEHLIEAVEIPQTLDVIKQEKIREIAKRAFDETMSLWPVPKYMEIADLERTVEKVAFGH